MPGIVLAGEHAVYEAAGPAGQDHEAGQTALLPWCYVNVTLLIPANFQCTVGYCTVLYGTQLPCATRLSAFELAIFPNLAQLASMCAGPCQAQTWT